MELPVFFQAEQAALAALLGVLLAALYDLLRALRRVLPGAAGFADGLFALVFFLSMLAFALYPGQGVFRLGFFWEIALGAAAYFLTLSRLLLQIFEGILRAIRQILHTLLQPVRFGAKKFSVFLKNLFARCKKWGTISVRYPETGRILKGVRQSMKLVKSSLLVKLVILILVVYATVTLVSLRKQITEKNEQEAILNSSIAATQQENNRIQDSIDALGTDAGVEAVARDKLGMVDEGDIVFYDVGE